MENLNAATESPSAYLGATLAEQAATHGDHMRERLEKAREHHEKLMYIIRNHHPDKWISLAKKIKPEMWVDHSDNKILARVIGDPGPTMHESRKLSALDRAAESLESIEEASDDSRELNYDMLRALEKQNHLLGQILKSINGRSN